MCHDGLNESGYSRHSIRLIDHPCIMTPLQELKHELRCWFLFFSDWAAEIRAWASREEEMKPIFVVKLFAFDHSVQFIFQCFAFIPFCWIRWWYFWFVDISWNKDLILISFKPYDWGGSGGASRIINGSGVSGRHGCCLIMSGGAGGVNSLVF